MDGDECSPDSTALSAACLERIWQNFFLGQIDLILALAVSIDLPRPPPGGGVVPLTGAAIGIKLTPAILLPLLLLIGHRRAARNAVLGIAATVLLALLVAPSASGKCWLRDVFSAGRVGDQTFVSDQSVLAALLQILNGTNSHPYRDRSGSCWQ